MYERPPAPPAEPSPVTATAPTAADASPEAEESEDEGNARPGRKNFAKRLMEKQGWKAGQGLGRGGSGITKAIQMVAAKGKGNAGRGKIIDKNKRPQQQTRRDRSEVVCLRGVADGRRDLEEDGELMQLIGDVYKRHGRVVQIVIRWDADEGEDAQKGAVYVLFADEDSAEMAVNGLHRREVFEGNHTEASFYSKEKFEAREFP